MANSFGNYNYDDPNNPLLALLNGGALNGSSGVNIENAISQALSGGQIDPRLSAYGSFQNQGDNGSRTWVPNDPRVSGNGRVTLNGQEYVQLNQAGVGGPGHATDPSKVINNPEFGLLTPFNNVQAPDDTGTWIPGALLAMGVGGNVAASGLLSGSAGAGDTGTGAFDVGGSNGFGGSTAISGQGATGAAAGDYGLNVPGPLSQVPPAGDVGALSSVPNVAGSHGLLGGIQQAFTNPSSIPGLLGDAGTWAMSNPLQAAGLAQTAVGLLGGHGSPAKPAGGSGAPKGGSGTGVPTGTGGVQQQFYVNPYTLAQLQRSRGGM